MSSIFWIATNTIREIIRDRILYGLLIFAVLLIGLSFALGELSFVDQGRIAVDLGLAGIQLSCVIMSIFAGSTLVSREIEHRTILTLLVRPTTRTEFLLGKFAGLAGTVLIVLLGLSAILFLVIKLVGFNGTALVWVALLGIFFESLILLSLTLFLGVWLRPFLTISCALAFFLIGHFMNSLLFFTSKSTNASYRIFGTVVSRLLPNLEIFNWRSMVIYPESFIPQALAPAVFYGLAWVAVALSAAALIFWRRDFV